MFEYLNLDLTLNDEAPVLDPYVCDMQHEPLSEEFLSLVYNTRIVRSLRNAGFHEEYDIKLISRYSYNFSVPNIEYYVDEHCPNGAVYLLTFSANGMHFITPPYGQGKHSPMSWNEYILRVFNGEKLSLLIRAPWAQAKFINVGGVG